MTNVLEELNDYLKTLESKAEALMTEIEMDSIIDESSIDVETIRLTKLQSKYNNKYLKEFNIYSDTIEMKKMLKLERWKYYTGRQTNRYYHEHGGQPNELINKTDVDKYLDGDDYIQVINKIVSMQKSITDLIEKFSKELSNRGYNLKTIFEYRKWVACV